MKNHFMVSTIKSAIRIIGCIISIADYDVIILAVSLLLAECFGIVEEIVDTRR